MNGLDALRIARTGGIRQPGSPETKTYVGREAWAGSKWVVAGREGYILVQGKDLSVFKLSKEDEAAQDWIQRSILVKE
jgi:hypothetical protein